METVKKSNVLLCWFALLVSIVVFVGLLMWYPAWFWVALPFVLTCLVKALNAM